MAFTKEILDEILKDYHGAAELCASANPIKKAVPV
jgi:hypothetical protein